MTKLFSCHHRIPVILPALLLYLVSPQHQPSPYLYAYTTFPPITFSTYCCLPPPVTTLSMPLPPPSLLPNPYACPTIFVPWLRIGSQFRSSLKKKKKRHFWHACGLVCPSVPQLGQLEDGVGRDGQVLSYLLPRPACPLPCHTLPVPATTFPSTLPYALLPCLPFTYHPIPVPSPYPHTPTPTCPTAALCPTPHYHVSPPSAPPHHPHTHTPHPTHTPLAPLPACLLPHPTPFCISPTPTLYPTTHPSPHHTVAPL